MWVGGVWMDRFSGKNVGLRIMADGWVFWLFNFLIVASSP